MSDIIKCISTGHNLTSECLSNDSRRNSLDVTKITPLEIYKVIYHDFIAKINKGKFNRYCKLVSDENTLLANIEESEFFGYIKPEQIRSGCSVRLRDTESNYTAIADYLSYTKNLSEGFRTISPELRSLDELEILAEIQHRGGGSCLVDFSNNFFISLWFAVNGNPDDLGYLFCYDVNFDAFKSGNLSYLNKHTWTKDIEILLRGTQSTNTYLDDDRNKFLLWKPANINGRIARQDSVFVFGVEKFYIEEHEVIVLPIPPKWKLPILKCLKVYFGITSESVFPDIDGYSSTHSKISPLNDTTLYLNPRWNYIPNKPNDKIFNFELLQKGMSCLLKGEYSISLDYFHKALNTAQIDLEALDELSSESDKIHQQQIFFEILYSLGLCYKKLKKNLQAEYFFQKAFDLGLSILTGEKIKLCTLRLVNEEDLRVLISTIHLQKIAIEKMSYLKRERVRFIKKFCKCTDEYVDTLYDTKHYSQAKNIVQFLSQICVSNTSKVVLDTSYNCLTVLEHLKKKTKAEDLESVKLAFNSVTNCNDCELYAGINNIIDLLLSFMKRYRDAHTDLNSLLLDDDIKNNLQRFDDFFNNSAILNTHSNINWMFDDLHAGIKEYFKENNLIVEFFEEKISRLQSLQDAIQCNKQV